MDETLKHRIIAVIWLTLVGIGGTWWNWHLFHSKGQYYPKIAMICPACFIFAIYFGIVPDDPFGKPAWSAKSIIAVAASIMLGVANWYAMANGYY